MRYILTSLLLIFLIVPNAGARPVVVELFTSQGCSSCPPADRLLGEIARDPEVLALSFHVDYWNYIGWADPFSSPLYTSRQRAYGSAMGLRSIYTPQAVVDGMLQGNGASRRGLQGNVSRASEVAIDVPIILNRENDMLNISIAKSVARKANVFLVGYDKRHETEIPRGENKGRKLVNNNVVSVLQNLGKWDGSSRTYSAKVPETDEFVVLLQDEAMGRIIGVGN